MSGDTPKMISKYRPNCPIISGTTKPHVYRQTNMSWGVIPIMIQEQNNTDDLFEHVVDVAVKNNLVKNGDLAVITAGVPLGVSGTTNLLKVHLVGDVLVTGMGVTDTVVCGKVCVCQNIDEVKKIFHPGEILVMPKTDNDVFPYIKECIGLITEEGGINSHAAIAGLALGKPVLVRAKNATKFLKTGTTITLDTGTGNVYSGTSKHLKANKQNQ
jgi:pyruvate kinase